MINDLIKAALLEDIGSGDVTTQAVVTGSRNGVARVIAKENFIVCGVEIFKKVFLEVDNSVRFTNSKKDGDRVKRGDTLIELKGRMASLLTGERTALNFIQRLSGIATLTQKYVSAIRGSKSVVLDTRKTTPGWRVLEKYAVLKGGAKNHRKGLYDAILVKDNHIKAAGGVKRAIKLVKKNAGPYLKVEIETQSLSEVKDALLCGAEIIMLDNMPVKKMKEAVEFISGRALTEASGNITLENISDVAKTGVDFISVGAITHSAVSVDMSMKIT